MLQQTEIASWKKSQVHENDIQTKCFLCRTEINLATFTSDKIWHHATCVRITLYSI